MSHATRNMWCLDFGPMPVISQFHVGTGKVFLVDVCLQILLLLTVLANKFLEEGK